MKLNFTGLCRNNYGPPRNFVQKKGLWEGPVRVDGTQLSGWTIYPLEFTSAWVRRSVLDELWELITAHFNSNWFHSLSNWNNSPEPDQSVKTPTMTRFVLTLSSEPADTFIPFNQWGLGNRGVVFVNGFNIGRFSEIGPTRTFYVPAPLLTQGRNTVIDSFRNICYPINCLSYFSCRLTCLHSSTP